MKRIKNLMMFVALGAAFTSCEKENVDQLVTDSNAAAISSELVLNPNTGKSVETKVSENLGDIFNAVAPSECGSTAFNAVFGEYINELIADPIALANNAIYSDVNYYYSFLLNTGEQTFGADGKFTKLMVKRERELSKFWNMQNEITVNGQHTADLNDRNVWIEVLSTFYGFNQPDGSFVTLTPEQAAENADYFLSLNEESPNLPENPYFATDGFASSNKTIVIGDGLVRVLAEAGIEEGIVWTGILAHEWAHQVQFKNYSEWYPSGSADPDRATATRYTELEADFMAAYYMTHKRGATYNQKRVEEFFKLFFQIGDCGFANPGHHGTPLQRMAATELGFRLADSAQKQGHILTQQEAHEYFVAHVDELF